LSKIKYTSKKTRYFDILILLLIISFHGLNNYVWVNKDVSCPSLHESVYLFQAVTSNYIIGGVLPYFPPNQPNATRLKSLNNLMLIGSGALSFIYSISSALSNTDLSNMRMINILYLSILIFSTYAIGKKLYNRKVGLLSSFLVSFYPIVFGISRLWVPELMQISMTALSIYVLLITDKLKNIKYCLLFGFILGLPLLTKISAPLFLIGPIAYYTFISFKKQTKELVKIKLMNLLLIFLVMIGTISIFVPYIILDIPNLLNYLSSFHHAHSYFLHSYPQSNLSYLIMSLIKVELLPIFFLLFLPSFIYFVKKKDKNYILAIWILTPFLIFTFSPESVMSIRLMTPILPAIAILSSRFLLNFKKMILKRLLLLFFILFAISQFFIMSYSFNILDRGTDNFLISKGPNLNEFSDLRGLNNLSVLILDSSYINNPPKKEECKIEDIFKTIEYNSRGDPFVIISSIGLDNGPINNIYLTKRFNFLIVDHLDGTYYENFDLIDFVIIDSDFSLNELKKMLPPDFLNELSRKYTFFIQNKNKFELLKEFKMSNGSGLILYKRNK